MSSASFVLTLVTVGRLLARVGSVDGHAQTFEDRAEHSSEQRVPIIYLCFSINLPLWTIGKFRMCLVLKITNDSNDVTDFVPVERILERIFVPTVHEHVIPFHKLPSSKAKCPPSLCLWCRLLKV